MIAMRYPRLAEKMALHVHNKYRDPVTQFFLDRYHRIEYLRKLDKRIIEEMSFHLKVSICQFNQAVITPGQECKTIYIVLKGKV